MDTLLTCSSCKQQKDVNEFYKSSRTKNGRLGKCIRCVLEYQNNNRGYNRTPTSQQRKIIRRNYKAKNREKHLAHRAVMRAIYRGQMIKQPCAVCGLTKVEAHHEDYSKRLEVTWLCRTHHMERHPPGRNNRTTPTTHTESDKG